MKRIIKLSHNQKLFLYEKLDLYDQNVDLSHNWTLSKGTGEIVERSAPLTTYTNYTRTG